MFLVFKIHASLYKKMQCISNYPTKEASYRKKKMGQSLATGTEFSCDEWSICAYYNDFLKQYVVMIDVVGGVWLFHNLRKWEATQYKLLIANM